MTSPFRSFLAAGAFLALIGAGCSAPPPTPQPPLEAEFDVTKTTCDDIPSARQKVLQAYAATIQAASETFQQAQQAFQDDLSTCLRDVWKGGPCDAQAKAVDAAYQTAMGNISSEDAYQAYKKARKDWDECYGNWEAKYKEWSDAGLRREADCRDEFNAKRQAALKAYTNAEKAAKAKRDADLAYLDDLEKKCKEKPKTQTGGTGTGGTQTGGVSAGGGTWIPVPPTVPASACAQTIPGENARPRTGRAPDFGPRDIAINLITQVAEDVTGTPLPTGVISDQIFAGIVCTKLYARIIELEGEAASAEWGTDRALLIRLRKKLDQYRRAQSIWCKIAEGRPALPEVKKDVAALRAMPSGFCKTDADCTGAPLCCSANTIATTHCNEYGSCVYQVKNCPTRDICMGPDSAQPRYDHCGPMHEGNWGYSQSRPVGSASGRPQPGVAR